MPKGRGFYADNLMKSKNSSCYLCFPEDKYVIQRFKNFTLVIDPYPLVKGHMMIISNNHYGCIGELPENHIVELQNHIKLILFLLNKKNDEVILYEHGRAGICIKNMRNLQCHHMHLHILPIFKCIHKELSQLYIYETICSFDELRKYFHGFGEYLYFQNNFTGFFYNTVGEQVLSHVIRTLLSKKIKKEHLSDWENYKDDQLIEANLYFKSNFMRNFEKI